MSAPPPSYEASELDTLISRVSHLNLTPSRGAAAPRSPTPPAPAAAHLVSTPNTPSRPSAMEPSQSPTKSPSKKKKNAAYAVFYGRRAGVYEHWYGPAGAEIQVRGVSYSLYQGYATVSQAEAAFEYARQRSWISPAESSTPLIPSLPTPQASDSLTINALHGGIFTPKWHIVYAGITPGIYASYLECALNTLGIPSAEYDSAVTHEEAQERWRDAVQTGRIRVLTHTYR
ncbi:hypothetical protein B0H11DRAFT_2243720 [Mycena galericulata]|nr:hypothetical protein B0H11DRAFT_2243720 [Mycena galericulata]